MKRIITVVCIVLIVGLSSFYVINYFFFLPSIKLNESNDLILNYKQHYIEPGYKATYKHRDVTNRVKVVGKVNSNKLGIYKIKYSLKKGFWKKTIIRKIKVRDITKPRLILESNTKDIYVCPNSEYDIEKYSAYDNYDKDITDKVKVTIKNNIVKYSVVDSSGNYTIKSRRIIKRDNEKPNIILNSYNIVFTFLNEEYIDSGFKVSDNCDKNIETKVKKESNIDINKAGSYEIKYRVKDSSGNETSVTRKVNVVKKGEKGTIYLTFDDGPRMGTTNIILDILKEEGIHATFFVTNGGPDELIKREYLEGHTVGLHTSSHDYSIIYSNKDNYFNDLMNVHDRVLNITGYDSRVIRFPGGSSNTVSRKYHAGIMSELTKEVLERNFKYYDWNINSRDTDGLTNHIDITNQVISRLSIDKVNVVLMHDIKPYTRDALKDIIKYSKENGYHFETITNDTEMMTQKVNN